MATNDNNLCLTHAGRRARDLRCDIVNELQRVVEQPDRTLSSIAEVTAQMEELNNAMAELSFATRLSAAMVGLAAAKDMLDRMPLLEVTCQRLIDTTADELSLEEIESFMQAVDALKRIKSLLDVIEKTGWGVC